MFCQRCGNALAPGARFCNACGTPVTAPVAPISTARPTLVTFLAILHFVGGTFLLLGGALGLFVSASETPSERAVSIVLASVVLVVVIGFIGIFAAIAIPNLLTAMQRSRQMRTIADMNRMARSVETYRESHNAPPPSITPAKDAWTNDLRYVTDGTNYWIVSAGKDGRFEENDVSHYTKGATTSFDDDIVLENGEMLRWPRREGR